MAKHSWGYCGIPAVPWKPTPGIITKRRAFWDNPEYKSLSPYPFLDVASLITSAGGDPLGNLPRENDELPAHHPLHDARQSSRLLHTVL